MIRCLLSLRIILIYDIILLCLLQLRHILRCALLLLRQHHRRSRHLLPLRLPPLTLFFVFVIFFFCFVCIFVVLSSVLLRVFLPLVYCVSGFLVLFFLLRLRRLLLPRLRRLRIRCVIYYH